MLIINVSILSQRANTFKIKNENTEETFKKKENIK